MLASEARNTTAAGSSLAVCRMTHIEDGTPKPRSALPVGFCRKSAAVLATIAPVKAIYLIPAAILLLLPRSAHAQLKWEQTTLELSPAVADKQAIGHFKYQNTGGQAIHF